MYWLYKYTAGYTTRTLFHQNDMSMTTINVTDSKGESKAIEIKTGLSLMEVLHDADYEEVEAICGGSCSCATCHVHIPEQAAITLPPMEEDEQALVSLADGYDAQQSRLSCQIQLEEHHDGLNVVLLDED